MSRLRSRTDVPDAPVRNRLTPDTFAEAFAASSRALWCIAAGALGNRSGVEDALQEGAMIALTKLDQFDPDTSFLAWMGQIVRYVALNHARRRQRSPVAPAAPEVLQATAAARPRPRPSPATSHGELAEDTGEFDDQVVAALGTLEETARSCLLLRTILDLPYREISLALGIPEGTAMSHVHRARRTMRERLYPGETLKDGPEWSRAPKDNPCTPWTPISTAS